MITFICFLKAVILKQQLSPDLSDIFKCDSLDYIDNGLYRINIYFTICHYYWIIYQYNIDKNIKDLKI